MATLKRRVEVGVRMPDGSEIEVSVVGTDAWLRKERIHCLKIATARGGTPFERFERAKTVALPAEELLEAERKSV